MFSKGLENTVGKGEIVHYSAFNRLVLETGKNQGLFGKGLKRPLSSWRYEHFLPEKVNVVTFCHCYYRLVTKIFSVDNFLAFGNVFSQVEKDLQNVNTGNPHPVCGILYG